MGASFQVLDASLASNNLVFLEKLGMQIINQNPYSHAMDSHAPPPPFHSSKNYLIPL